MEKIGSNIRKTRKALGMTQTELAKKLGTSQNVITNWEREINNPPAAKLPLLSKALGVSIPELYGRSGEPDEGQEKAASLKSRSTQMQKTFDQLKPSDQRSILKLAKGLLKS